MSDYLPAKYKKFVVDYPEVAAAYEALGKACHEIGPLDEKTRHLIKLGIAAAAQSEGAVRSHVRRASAAGATAEEIRHAVLLVTTTCGFPSTVAALAWVDEAL